MKVLIKNEFRLCFRTIGIVLFLALFGGIPMLLLSMAEVNSINDTSVINNLLRSSLIFLPAMLIPLIGTAVFQTSLNEERKNRILNILLADGVKPNTIWVSKMAASITIAYGISLCSLIISILFIRVSHGILINLDLESILMLLFVVPVISITFFSIIGTIMWYSKQGMFFAGLLPLVSYMGILYLNVYLIENNKSINAAMILLLALLSLAVFLVCMIIAKKVKKEHIVNMSM
ncbi:MAG: hypothetical protein FWG91_08800 [Lachnospiraceae bacterium]|nr:hypothetical protein [Lachnospiraceae bacterium]